MKIPKITFVKQSKPFLNKNRKLIVRRGHYKRIWVEVTPKFLPFVDKIKFVYEKS